MGGNAPVIVADYLLWRSCTTKSRAARHTRNQAVANVKTRVKPVFRSRSWVFRSLPRTISHVFTRGRRPKFRNLKGPSVMASRPPTMLIPSQPAALQQAGVDFEGPVSRMSNDANGVGAGSAVVHKGPQPCGAARGCALAILRSAVQ